MGEVTVAGGGDENGMSQLSKAGRCLQSVTATSIFRDGFITQRCRSEVSFAEAHGDDTEVMSEGFIAFGPAGVKNKAFV